MKARDLAWIILLVLAMNAVAFMAGIAVGAATRSFPATTATYLVALGVLSFLFSKRLGRKASSLDIHPAYWLGYALLGVTIVLSTAGLGQVFFWLGLPITAVLLITILRQSRRAANASTRPGSPPS